MAGDTIHMAGLRPAEIEGCRRAEPVDVDAVVCAERERILVINGKLSACTFAKPARFGPLALPTAFDGIPCQAGDRATFFWGGQLMECTLSRDADLSTTITTPDGAAQVRKLRCMATSTTDLFEII